MMSIASGLLTSLVDVMAALGDLSAGVKVSWLVLFAWVAVQVWLFRKLRTRPEAPAPAPDPDPVPAVAPAKAPRRPRAPRKKKVATAPAMALPADTAYR